MDIPQSIQELAGQLQEYVPPVPVGRVYFLIDGDEVVYVGQTTQIEIRINKHSRGAGWVQHKQFDRVLFIDVPVDQLLAVEKHWIDTLKPKYNRPAAGIERTRQEPVDPAIVDELRELSKADDDLPLPERTVLATGLPSGVASRLFAAGFRTVESVLMADDVSLLTVRGFGFASLEVVRGLQSSIQVECH